MTRLAVLVGIDHYESRPLSGCARDAYTMEKLLHRNGDEQESANFQCNILTSDRLVIGRNLLLQSAQDVFNKPNAEMALFYFAGHGARSNALGGHLVVQGRDETVGMSELIALANGSPSPERIIVLDCCYAGLVDELAGTQMSVSVGPGVAILAGSAANEYAAEAGGKGFFTGLICDALKGGAADVRGAVTLAGIFAYLNEVLTGFDQQPLLHANLRKLTQIRRARPAVTDTKLRRVTEFFTPLPEAELKLSPRYEPTVDPHDPECEEVFGVLQELRAGRLVEPVGTPHMYFAAMRSLSCRLTPLGRFYWRAVKAGRI
jgi:hypothetical protein